MLKRLLSSGLLAMWVASVAVVTPGCAGEEGSDSSVPPDEDLRPVSTLSQDERAFFLRRTHFCVRPSELAQLNALGYEDYLDWMLSMPSTAALETAGKSAMIADVNFPGSHEIVQYWTYLMVNSSNPFQEMLALFWHDHFAASTDALVGDNNWWAYSHMDLWRKETTGSLNSLLYKMSTDWLMLAWLNGIESTKTAPNENFAREFWELFTLGADNGYTQADIQECARSFTGYRSVFQADYFGAGLDSRVIQWDSNRHDNTSKAVFGQTVNGNGQAEYQDIVNLTLGQRGTQVATFICRKLWEYFCYLSPSSDLLSNLASGLIASSWDLKALYKRIFMSKAFFSSRNRDGLIKSPLHYHIGYMRNTGLLMGWQRVRYSLEACGQVPSRPPTVNGWPVEMSWLSSQGVIERANFIRDLNNYQSEQPGYDVGNSIIPAGQTGDAAVVDYLCWLMQVTLEPAQRTRCIDYLNNDYNGSSVKFAQPWDFSDATQRNKKIRGLLYILSQHPSYQVR